MFRFLFRLLFRSVALLLLAAAAFVVYQLYRSGELTFVQRAIEDAAVTGSVKAAFAVHRDLSSRPIEVTTQGGQVTLAGDVATEDERGHAIELASNIEGVESVDNRLGLNPDLDREPAAKRKSLGEHVDDAALLAKIRTALHLDRQARRIDLDIQVSSGHVILRGEVPSEELAGRIRMRVGSVGGVEHVDDELEVKP